jgi:SAM-dependent methyltransferase
MVRPPYYRDIWCLASQSNEGTNCKGQFPRGFMSRVMNKWGKGKRDKIMLFSGAFHELGWDTVDVRPEMKPSILANCEKLPIPSSSYDLVVMDPPYSEQEAKELYGLEYVKMGTALNEAARILRPGGNLCCLHRIVPQCWPSSSEDFKRCRMIAVVGVFTLSGMSNLRALTVWRKLEGLPGLFAPETAGEMPQTREEDAK